MNRKQKRKVNKFEDIEFKNYKSHENSSFDSLSNSSEFENDNSIYDDIFDFLILIFMKIKMI